ncbi:MAG: zinc-binding dehydrogenase [Thermoanaerobaculia bacterium]|nr:zinc-binding dehydrogenase [Thermoanaerobaculia bacterium]
MAATSLQLRSTARSDGTLELSLAEVPVPEPGPDEVIVRVDASPINPSDLGMMFGPADLATVRAGGDADRPAVTADIPEALRRTVEGRLDQALPVGNEGAGEVIAAGSSEEAQALLGRTVAILGGAMYAQHRAIKAKQCLVLPEGTTAVEGAACFVNPLTVLGMVETMRLEGHTALVHTAAASNLGQMLQKLCLAEDVPLVNIVRREEQEELLRGIGATWVCNSSRDGFMNDLIEALAATGATLGFDAIGGGRIASQILTAMEAALLRNATEFNRYGSTTHKQVYIYGGLDRGPTELARGYGMAWGVGGWLLPPFLQRIGPEAAQRLRERVAAEITTTFASSYSREISLREALDPDTIAAYGRMATGEKFLVRPNRG